MSVLDRIERATYDALHEFRNPTLLFINKEDYSLLLHEHSWGKGRASHELNNIMTSAGALKMIVTESGDLFVSENYLMGMLKQLKVVR